MYFNAGGARKVMSFFEILQILFHLNYFPFF